MFVFNCLFQRHLFLLLLVLVVFGFGVSPYVQAGGKNTTYYLLRHAEINKKDPAKPLNDNGKKRAKALASYMSGYRLTHIYATHTDRTRDTVKPLAKFRGLNIVQVPTPGSKVDGKTVNNMAKGKIAIKPMISALKSLPPGSSVLVSANSGNLYAILAGLGVPVDKQCKVNADNCIPCKAKKCFPKKQFNNIWSVKDDGSGRVKMIHGTYGD